MNGNGLMEGTETWVNMHFQFLQSTLNFPTLGITATVAAPVTKDSGGKACKGETSWNPLRDSKTQGWA